MSTIASLMVQVLADTSDIKRSMQVAEQSVSNFAAMAKKAFVGIVTVEAIRRTAEYADNIGDLATKAGVSTDFIQKAGYAAKITGGSMEGLANAVVMLQKGLAGGDKGAVEAVNQLGLSLADLKRLSPEQQFTVVADALGKVSDAGTQTDLTLATLGKAGKENLAAIREGFSKLGDEAAATGQVMESQTIEALGNFNDTLDRTLTAGKSVLASVLTPFVPALEALATAVGWVSTHFVHLTTAVWKVVDPFKKISDGIADWKYFLGITEAALPPVKKLGDAFGTASRAAGPLNADLDKALQIETHLTNMVPKATDAFEDQGDAFLFVGTAIDSFLPKFKNIDGQLVAIVDDLKQAGEQFKFLQWAIEGVTSTLPPFLEGLPKVPASLKIATTETKTFRETFTDAMDGVSGVLDSIGGKLAQTVTSITRSISGAMKAFAKGEVWGGVAAIAGGITGVLSQLGDKIFKTESRQVNDLRDAFFAAQGGYAQLHQTLIDANAESAFFQVWNAKTMKDWETGVAAVNAALDSHTQKLQAIADLEGQIATLQQSLVPTWDQVKATLDKYNISLDATGQKVQQLRMIDWATELLTDYDLLMRAGMDTTAIVAGMGDKLREFVGDSLKYGTEIPANMQPVIQSLIDQGKLFDDAGKKITDLGQLKWGAPIKTEADVIREAIKQLVDKVGELIDKLSGVGTAVAAMPKDVSVHVGYKYDAYNPSEADVPALAAGGLVTRPTLALVGESGPEAVVPLSRGLGLTGAFDTSRIEDKLDQLLSVIPTAIYRAQRDAILIGG